jgi:hypothetical protein
MDYSQTQYFHGNKMCTTCKQKPARLGKTTKAGSYCPECARKRHRKYYADTKNKPEHTIVKNHTQAELYEEYKINEAQRRIEREMQAIRRARRHPSHITAHAADLIFKQQ